MAFWDKLFGEFVDVIEWTDDTRDTMVWRFERHGHEIKYGAKLTVREGQSAIFVNEGTMADVFGPGLYTLETQNMPVLSTLKYFRDEYEAHVAEHRCPAAVCKELITFTIDAKNCNGCTICAKKCPQDAIT